MHSSTFTYILVLASTAAAAAVKPSDKPTRTTSPHYTTSAPDNACGIAKAAAESYLADKPEVTLANIAPSLAWNCLSSVPVDKERDLDLLNYIEPYILFQSTLEPLASPPEGYLIPGVDVVAGLGQIRSKLTKDEYESQVDFATDLRDIFIQASDGHFIYKPAILNIFGFVSVQGVVSVADEVTGLPRVYLSSDFNKSVINNTNVYDIDTIDGVPVAEFLEAHSYARFNQDPDAKYNTLFINPATGAQGGGNSFRVRLAGATPDEEVIKFTNGTTYVNKIWARVLNTTLPFIDSAESLHKEFEVPATATSASSSVSATATSTPSPTLTAPIVTQLSGYPEPVAFHEHSWISGYFLNGSEYDDVAVLAILSFSPWIIPESQVNATFEIEEAARTVADFLRKAKDAGKKKLIIDVQGNGGGLISAGYQLYNQLFPQVADIWDGTRLRANEALEALGKTAEESSKIVYEGLIGSLLDADRKPFKGWDDLYGPEFVADQNVTNILRYNQSEVGYIPSREDQVFSPENMVVVTDGGCASTCTIFTGLLVREHGVRTIALGGRPLNAAMQAVGGVEGAQVLNFVEVREAVTQIKGDALEHDNTRLLVESYDSLPSTDEPPLLPPLAQAGAFNYRNAYARKTRDGFPEQFVYEAANCRLFYTEQMIVNPVAIWNVTADTAWGRGRCVRGSTVNADDTIGDETVAFDAKVVSKVEAYSGPGSLSYKGAYEPPRPYVQKQGAQKRSIEDGFKLPDGFVYTPGPRIGVSA
ncbi:Peptidase S41 family protein ustP [Colletotrichum sidae]|uniref:Peptidase S41 family protein ustP n=1 Tax=Colletotrichum sidae TaxID=1347389 RepID=A0A4R8TKB6_9PEZI|nr:Peptidase S41 family protein ustP [Colletotrichum sidae]